jgi:hypothetical protein
VYATAVYLKVEYHAFKFTNLPFERNDFLLLLDNLPNASSKFLSGKKRGITLSERE